VPRRIAEPDGLQADADDEHIEDRGREQLQRPPGGDELRVEHPEHCHP
jgi:hypothetical protein